MPLGDSITKGYIGPSVADEDLKGYRQPLWQLLNNANYGVDFVGDLDYGNAVIPAFDYHNEGHGGWTTSDMNSYINGILNANPPDIILLHLGTNDWSTNVTNLENILDKIDVFETSNSNPIKVFLAKIINHANYHSVTTQYNNNLETMANARISSGDDIVLVDMENGAGIDYGTDMYDNLHPNALGYEKIADKWFSAIQAELGNSLKVPSSVVATPMSYSIIELSWADNSSAETGYEVDRALSASGPFTQIADLTANSTTYMNSGLSNDTEYFYRVRAKDATRNGVYSDTVSATTLASPSTRVTDGLLALYKFEEGSGTTVNDVGASGTPLNLEISNISAVTWGIDYLNLGGSVQLAATSSPDKIYNGCTASNEITVEAWIKPVNNTQSGPARIVTFSTSSSARNFTLGQDGAEYQMRIRISTDTGQNGTEHALSGGSVNTSAPSHLVYTKNSTGVAKLYVDGSEVGSRSDLTGDFSNWNSGYGFALADEFSASRQWNGVLYLSAIYSKALSTAEIDQNYNAGPLPPDGPLPVSLVSWTGYSVNNHVSLEWKTATEVENLGFEIERSIGTPDNFIKYASYLSSDELKGQGNSSVATKYEFHDYEVRNNEDYYYRLSDIDFQGIVTTHPVVHVKYLPSVSNSFEIYGNYPNPFNPATTLVFSVANRAPVSIKIFNNIGQLVRILQHIPLSSGRQKMLWDGNKENGLKAESGIYYYQIFSGERVKAGKMVMLK